MKVHRKGVRLRNPASREERARLRVDLVFERLDRLTASDLDRVALPPPTDPDVEVVRRRAYERIRDAGLQKLVTAAHARARDALMARYGREAMYQPTFVGLTWTHSAVRPRDRLAFVAAVDDALLAAVAGDLVTPDDRELLESSFDAVG